MQGWGRIKNDEYYTPDNVYNAVRDWAMREFDIEESQIVRPFWPGGDYEKFEYPPGCVVVDNPPFSILAEIRSFFMDRDIPFFLFTPGNVFAGLSDERLTYIVCSQRITYCNGKSVITNFITNMMPGIAAESRPDLDRAITAAISGYTPPRKNY